METPQQHSADHPLGNVFFREVWDQSWTYIKTVVDVVREPVLILDSQLSVMAANEAFYRAFQVDPKVTEGVVVYELGNGQWNIPSLRKLLEDILPKNTFFKGYEVAHDFPLIGRKVMILNARQIHVPGELSVGHVSPIIMLAMEDVTEMMVVADTLAGHANLLEARFLTRTEMMETKIKALEHEIHQLKKK